MAFQVSPGVNISEIDASTSVPAVITNVGAVVGRFAKGPVSEVVEISSEEQLLNTFGSPNDTNYKSWYTAANFLSYSDSLKVVRVVADGDGQDKARNALSGKVTAAAAVASTQTFTGQDQDVSTLYGSSRQEFKIDSTVARGTQFNLHTGIEEVLGNATPQFLQPRSSTAIASSVTLVTPASAAAGDHAMRKVLASDVSVFMGNSTVTNTDDLGLIPANRYSLSDNLDGSGVFLGSQIDFTHNLGQRTSAGPYFVYHGGSTGKRLVTSGSEAEDMTAGFTYPLYTRQSTANLADSGIYGGDGASHVHYSTTYGGAASAASGAAMTLPATHGLIKGDVVVYHTDQVVSGAAVSEVGLKPHTTYFVAAVSGADVELSETYNYSTETAGTSLSLSAVSAYTHALYQAFYMPSSNTAMNHSKSTAPVEPGMLPYLGVVDTVTIVVAQQSTFTLNKAPGAAAVSGNLVGSVQSGTPDDDDGNTDTDITHGVTDYSVTANSNTITYTSNLPRTLQTEVVTVPRQKTFKLQTPVDVANGQTIEVKINDVVANAGTELGEYILSTDGANLTFGGAVDNANFKPKTADTVLITVSSKLTNSFTYDSAQVLMKNSDAFGDSNLFASSTSGMNLTGHEFVARSPGNWANNLHVYLIDESSYDTFVTEEPSIASGLSGKPRANDGTIDPAETQIGEETISQGLSLIVTEVNSDGIVTTVEILENLSKAGNGTSSEGQNIYYVDYINTYSNYVFCVNHPQTSGMDWGSNLSLTPGSIKRDFAKLNQVASTADGSEVYISRPFGNGYDGQAPQQGNFESGFTLYSDTETVDVSFLMQGESADLSESPAGMVNHIINIAATRKDCIACISPTESVVLSDKSAGGTTHTRTFYGTVAKSNYAFADSNYKYMSDKYNNKFRYVPFNGDTAGLMVRSEVDRDAWFSPAGFNRGVYKGVVKTMMEQTKSARDALYKDAINPVVNFAGQGTVLFGDKTFTMKPSAFDRINVRRLFIVLEKSIATAAKFTLFEFNDEFTRAQFTSLIEPFLRDIKGRRGIYDFKVVCDSTNNTTNVIDSNQFVGDIFIQPARSINFIQLNFVAVRTGVSFDEIVGVV
jgi:hypothetical protein